MSLGGGGGGVEETEKERAVAEIADKRYDYYQSFFVPMENKYISDVQEKNSAQSHADLADGVRAEFDTEFNKAADNTQEALAKGGFDPNSGKAVGALEDLAVDHGAGSADATNRAQVELQDSYVGGLQNIVAIGEGQATTAQKGMQDIANSSANIARDKAHKESVAGNNVQSLASMAVGAGTEIYRGNNNE